MQQSTRAWRRVAAVMGAAALVVRRLFEQQPVAAPSRVTVIGTWGGDEEKNFKAMVAPWEKETGNTVKYTGTRDINQILTTGVASGVLPDLAGLPGPGQMKQFAKAGALKPLDDVLDMAKYKDETAPALVDLGTVDGKTVGVFIKAAVKGLIWYNPKLHDYSAAPPETLGRPHEPGGAPTRAMPRRPGASASSPAPRPAGRAPTGSRTSSCARPGPDKYDQWWPGKLKWSSPEIKTAFQTFGKVAADAPTAVRAPSSRRTSRRAATRSSRTRLAASSTTRPLHHRPRRVQGRQGRHRLQLLPVPGHRPAVHGCDRRRRRPVRHVPRHARGEVADEVPRHRARPGHLGQGRRRALGEQERHELSRTTSRSGRPRS